MKLKKFLSLFVAVIMAATIGIVAGCKGGDGGENTPTQLKAPVLELAGNVLSWNKVDNADGYIVKEGSTETPTTERTYTINKTEVGEYTYTVFATSTDKNYTKSPASNAKTYKVEAKQEDNPPAEDTSAKFSGKIFLVGDSTVCSFEDKYYMPRYGYGTQISSYFNIDEANVKNLALSGRSSWSFLSESNYTTLKSSIGAGDYLFIGFGHNDEKFEVARYSNPTLSSSDSSTMIGTYDTGRIVSFKNILKTHYINVAKNAGAIPVLCTPITRLFEDNKKSSYDSVHVTSTKTDKDSNSGVTTEWTGGNYVTAIKELAVEEKLLCVDLTSLTVADYKDLGYAEASKYHAATGAQWADSDKTEVKATGIDATHTNLFGAKMNAYHIANAVKASELDLKANVKTNNKKPTYEENKDQTINSEYEIVEREPFNPEKDASKVWTGITGSITDKTTDTTYKWYGTTMGGSAKPNSSYFTMTQGEDANGITFNLKAESNSKIEDGGDSIGCVFIQVPFKTDLTFEATATVKSFGGNQSGFGLMIRDDITIDLNQSTATNYVTAGCLGKNGGAYMGFARNASVLSLTGTNADVPKANDVLNLKLARSSQSITATTGGYIYNAVSDFDLAASDSDYVYICLWVSRGAQVTFSKLSFASGTWVDP